MGSNLYSVDQVAELLGLHVRTVRNYVRDGRLKAVKIGKQYRITQAELAALTGAPAPAAPGRRHVEVSSIVQIDGIGAASASRLSTLLTAGAQAPRATLEPLRIQTIHDEDRSRMKIVILGGPAETADIVRLIGDLLDSGNGLLEGENDDE
jgi:excisionase family DNA binding protein